MTIGYLFWLSRLIRLENTVWNQWRRWINKSMKIQFIVRRIWNFDTNEYPNIFVLKKKQYEWISKYIRIKKTIRTNVRIYSYKKWYEYDSIKYSKIFEYTSTGCFLTVFLTRFLANIFISRKRYKRISEYIRTRKPIQIVYIRIVSK